MEIQLFRCNADNIKVDKRFSLSDGVSLIGTLRDGSSITTPTIKIEIPTYEDEDHNIQRYNMVNFNYVYIPEFNRYYFIDDMTFDYNNIVTLTLKCDVLFSFAQSIYLSRGIITRSPYGNAYVADRSDTEKLTVAKEVINIPVNTANSLSPSTILIVAGGQ